MAANKDLGQVEYSAKYSAVTKALLENWLEYTCLLYTSRCV